MSWWFNPPAIRCVLFLMLAAAPCGADDRHGTIAVQITGLRSDKGTVLVQLANSANDYAEDERAFRGAEVKSSERRATAVFPDVPYGEYAVKVFQDENDNRKIDMGLMGPTEAYGFSNNVFGMFGPPPFEKAKFTLGVPALTIAIETR